MGDIGAPELLIIGVVIVLLFGASRLPATAKGLGQALRLFKKEIRADDEPAAPAAVAPVQQLRSTPEQSPAAMAPAATAPVATEPGAVAAQAPATQTVPASSPVTR